MPGEVEKLVMTSCKIRPHTAEGLENQASKDKGATNTEALKIAKLRLPGGSHVLGCYHYDTCPGFFASHQSDNRSPTIRFAPILNDAFFRDLTPSFITTIILLYYSLILF